LNTFVEARVLPCALDAAMALPPVVRTLEPDGAERWDAFVAACPDATFFHRAGWRTVIEQAFGHKTWFLYAEQAGRIEGVLPLAQVNSLLFGNALVSLPFCVYGGIAATSEVARAALDRAAQALAARLGVGHLEYRNMRTMQPTQADWISKDLYVTFRKEIFANEAANMQAIPRKQRAMVRKGISAGLTSDMEQGVDHFFDAYAASVHRLGTPVFAKQYFRILRDVFGDDCDVMTIKRDGRAISSVLSFYFRDEVLPYYGGGTAEAREVAGNDFMYWELMRRAALRGCRVFDFGRSKRATGAYDFKKNWGFDPQPLPYAYQLHRAKALPENNPLNPKYQRFIRFWQKLPLPLANALGPHIVKNLG
jgi:FemAB-related protein (PEP-CTERM system-associated)